jgi:hypothetical protein
MRLKEILKEHTYELFVGPTKNSWGVRNRFTDEVMAGNLSKEEAEAIQQKLDAEAMDKEKEYWAKGGTGMMPGDVSLAAYRDK